MNSLRGKLNIAFLLRGVLKFWANEKSLNLMALSGLPHSSVDRTYLVTNLKQLQVIEITPHFKTFYYVILIESIPAQQIIKKYLGFHFTCILALSKIMNDDKQHISLHLIQMSCV